MIYQRGINMIILILAIILLIISFHVDTDLADVLRAFSLAMFGGMFIGFLLF